MNNNVYSTAEELIKKGKLPHAILIDGGNAADRNDFADFLATSFVCDSTTACGMCKNCLKAKNNSHPDIIISDPELQNEKTFKIDVVREIRKDSHIMPNEAKHKVYVLRKADKMNFQAQNALLKTLEEPPAHARFILTCESRAALLETIMSRVTPFNLGTGDNIITDENDIKADNLANELALALADVTELKFMQLTAVLEKDKDLFPSTLSSLQLIFRDAVAVSTNSNVLLTSHVETSRKLASKLQLKTLIALVENTEHFFDCLNKNANKNLLITRFCSVLRNTAYPA